MKYTNPILPGFYPDPSICRVGEDYYLVTSSFVYFPGVPIFHSRDLIHWRQIGHCLTRPSQLQLEKARTAGGIYAPTLRHHNGRFYMVTTNVTDRGHFYVHTDDPAGEWSEPIWVSTPDIPGSIDPSLMFDDDDKVYFTCTSGQKGIYQFEINIETGEQRTPSKHIWTGTGGKWPEAPHLYKINGMYYLMIAEGGTEYGHMETIARSISPYGPFEACARNPILTHRSLESPIQALGHADLVQAHDGRWWLVCLGTRPNGYPMVHHLGRETFLAPVTWAADGWPTVNRDGQIQLEIEANCLPQQPFEPDEPHDDFVVPEIGLPFNFLRNPNPDDWSLEANPGYLRLYGSPLTLDDVGSPAFIGRRQQHFKCRVSAGLEFHPEQERDEAGLTVFMNEHHHYEVAVTRLGNERVIIVRRRVGSLTDMVAGEKIGQGRVSLGITANQDNYYFSYTVRGQEPKTLASGETRYLATEVAGGFTGVYFAMYATGNGKRSLTPADFDHFTYTPLD